jgi:hypothetical protein
MLEFLRRNGLRRGLVGGSRSWMVAGGLAYALRALRWVVRRDTEVVFSEELRPGESLVITPIEPPNGSRSRKR